MRTIDALIFFLYLLFVLSVSELMAQTLGVEPAFLERFDSPLSLEYSDEESSLLYIVSREGHVYVKDVDNPEEPSEIFIDISDRITRDENEQGLLGMAFSPEYLTNETFYLYYTYEVSGEYYSTLSRFKAPGGLADPDSEERLLDIFQPDDNHNGGKITFGPDGYLYMGVGDGGRNSRSNAQNTLTLNGSILRIDVSDETGYTIPSDNPFVGDPDGLDEIYAWGFRNPWRISFDPVTGYLWVADVGQKKWESIYIVEKGKNYGWSIIEGDECYPIGTECDKTGLELPLFQYPWGDDFGKSITGGYVYRGSDNPSLYGKYIYGDFITRQIWALEIDHDTKEVISNIEIAEAEQPLPTFGLDSRGEIYIAGWRTTARIFRFEKEDPLQPPGAVVLSSPEDGAQSVSLEPVLSWEEEVQANLYEVHVAESSEFEDLVMNEADLTQTELQLTGLKNEVTYYWRVRAVNDAGAGEWSEVWDFTTASLPAPDIRNVKIRDDGEDIVLSWESVNPESISEFMIYRGSTSGDLNVIENLPGDRYSFTDTNILQGPSFYVVSVLDNSGTESGLSEIVSFYNGEIIITDEWEMISVPIDSEQLVTEDVQLFSFSGSYESEISLIPLKGYWAKSNTLKSYSVRGEGVEKASILLEKGWNMIGGLTGLVTIDYIEDSDGVLTNAPVYSYNGIAYETVTALDHGKGYWIYAEKDGSISLDIEQSNRDKATDTGAEFAQTDMNKIIFTYQDVESVFTISEVPLTQDLKNQFLVPPLPPQPVLDVRTKEGYSVTDVQSEDLVLSTPGYPVHIRTELTDNSDDHFRIIAFDERGNEIHFNLTSGGTYSLEKPYESLLLEQVESDELIKETTVNTIYPNPFNPSATIRYTLDQRAGVLLEVYDITGRKMSTLVNQEQDAGIYTVPFIGGDMATGIYFVRLRAGSHQSFQKMTLIK